MARYTKGVIKTERKKDTGNFLCRRTSIIKEAGRRAECTDKDCTNGRMGVSMKAIGTIMSKMASASTPSQTESGTRVNLKTTCAVGSAK